MTVVFRKLQVVIAKVMVDKSAHPLEVGFGMSILGMRIGMMSSMQSLGTEADQKLRSEWHAAEQMWKVTWKS